MRRPGVRIPLPPAYALRHKKRRLSRRSETKADFQCDLASVPQRLRLGRPAFFLHGPLSTRSAMKGFYYVYILVSEADGRLHYSGLTRDLNTRLAEHNRGKCPHTSKHRPWKSKQQSDFDRKLKLVVLNVMLRQDPDVNLRAATCDSFRGCHADASELPGLSLRFILCARSYLPFFRDNQPFVPCQQLAEHPTAVTVAEALFPDVMKKKTKRRATW